MVSGDRCHSPCTPCGAKNKKSKISILHDVYRRRRPIGGKLGSLRPNTKSLSTHTLVGMMKL